MTIDRIFSTPAIESVLNSTDHPDVSRAIEELQRVRAAGACLVAHVAAVQRQTESSVTALVTLADRAKRLPCILALVDMEQVMLVALLL
jgi:hypothetical protein